MNYSAKNMYRGWRDGSGSGEMAQGLWRDGSGAPERWLRGSGKMTRAQGRWLWLRKDGLVAHWLL